MRRLLLLLFLIFFCNDLNAQHFNRVYRTKEDVNIGARVAVLKDGNYIMYVQINTQTDVREGIIKVNTHGDTLWQKIYSDQPKRFYGYNIIECNDGFVIGGTEQDSATSNNTYYFYLQKFDTDGNSMWLKKYGYGGELIYAVEKTHDNGYILVGQSATTGTGSGDVFVIKTDSIGNEQWENYYGGQGIEIPYGVASTDSGYVISGVTGSFSGNNTYDHYVVKIDSIGKLIWEFHSGTKNDDYGGFITVLKDKNYILATASPNGLGVDYAKLIKISPAGKIIWEKHYQYSNLTAFNTKIVENDDGSLVGGLVYIQTPTSKPLGYLMKVNANGDSVWTKKYIVNASVGDYFYDIKPTKDGGFIVCGSGADTTNIHIQYAWLIKTDCEGNDSIHYAPNYNCSPRLTNVSAFEEKLTSLSISPNPFNQQATINYQIKKATHFSIYNIQGKLIQSILLSQNQTSITIDGNTFENGVYFYGIDGYSDKRKMVVLH